MVLLCASVLSAHAFIFYTFGIFLRPLTLEFGWERGALSIAQSICIIAGGLFAILTGRLTDRYGPRLLVTVNGILAGIVFFLMSRISSLWQVHLTWGLLMGIAGSFCYVPIISTVPRWFVKKRGMAMGLTVAGFGLGAIITPPLAQWLISAYEWRQAYVVLGIISLVVITPLAQFMKLSPKQMGLKPYGENGPTTENKPSSTPVTEGYSFQQAIKTGPFWLFGSILACFLFCIQVIIVHIAAYATDIKIPAIVAASILSIIAGGSVIGKLSTGFISDKVGARLALSACLITITLSLIWLLFAKEIWMLYLFAVVFGFGYGGIVPLQNLVPAELFGLKSLGAVVGSVLFFGTVGGAIGPPVAGYIFDVTKSYRLAFLICAILCAIGIILSLILLRSKTKGDVLVTK